MRPHSFAEKRKRVHQLRNRGEALETEFNSQYERNQAIEKKIEALSKQIQSFHAKNVELAQSVEEELLKRQTYHEIAQSLEAQTEILEKKYRAQRERYLSVAKENELLSQETDKLKAKKAAYDKYIRRAQGNQAAAEMRNRNLVNGLKALDEQTKAAQGFQERAKTFYREEGLQQRVERLAGKETKAAMALYTCLEALIQSVEENEFEGVKRSARIDKNKTKMGARLYFTNISSQYNDVVEHLSPVIKEMGRRFSKYGMNIETKAKKTASGIVSALDIKVVVNTSRPLHKHPETVL